uniref:Uncharacterized protein n=1 Tax=Megaviridae environmental sample TaxID=1737588 RepID=A0A5J6VMA1_9VIRU|nr:MAG: hypothetical protein [Megaviridae environmental sample]
MVKVDELIKEQRAIEKKNKEIYRKIYKLVETNIVNNNKKKNRCCFYEVSLFYHGLPLYSIDECVTYISDKLKKNGFKVKILGKNGILINW